VKTVLDFVRTDAASIREQFCVVLEKTLLELRGTSCLDLSDIDDAPTARQQILVSRSFGKAITDPAGIVEAVSEFASRAAGPRSRRLQVVLKGWPAATPRQAPMQQRLLTAAAAAFLYCRHGLEYLRGASRANVHQRRA
jgi:nucleotidyltransferase/DNA polymerase involved in DNA repair